MFLLKYEESHTCMHTYIACNEHRHACAHTHTHTHTHTQRFAMNGAPNDTQFVHFWRTRTDFHPTPLQVCPVPGVDPLNLLVRGVFTLYNFVLCVSLKKCEFLPLHQHQNYCLFSVVRSCVNYTWNPNTTFKIRFCDTQVLWQFSTSEHAVIPSQSMNRGWKYPLNNLGRVEVPPWKRENWEPCSEPAEKRSFDAVWERSTWAEQPERDHQSCWGEGRGGGGYRAESAGYFQGWWRRGHSNWYFSSASNGRQKEEGEADLGAVCFPEGKERDYAKEEGIEREAGVRRGVRVWWADNSEIKDTASPEAEGACGRERLDNRPEKSIAPRKARLVWLREIARGRSAPLISRIIYSSMGSP